MNGQTNYLKLGLFVLGGAALIVAVFLILTAGTIFRSEVMLETYFQESVYGLSSGSDVVYRGVKVGHIQDISFTAVQYELDKPLEARKPYVLVRFVVYPAYFGGLSSSEVTGLIKAWTGEGLSVQREPQGLTGICYLSMNFADPSVAGPKLEFDWEPRYPYVPSIPNVLGTVTDTIRSIHSTLAQVQKIDISQLGRDLDSLLTTTSRSVDQAQIGALAGEARGALADIRRSTDQLHKLLSSPDLASAVEDAAATAKASRQITETSEADLPKILANIQQVSDAMRKGSADLPQTMGDLNRALRALASLLDEQQQTVAETLRDLRAASQSVRDLTEKAEQYPAGTLFGAPPTPVHPGEDR